MKISKNIVKTLTKVNHVVGKHSPLILTVAGITGLGATAVFSYKAAKKVEVIVEDIEDARDAEQLINDKLLKLENTDPLDASYPELAGEIKYFQEQYPPLDRMEVAKRLTAALALPVATGILSISAIALSYKIQNNRIVGLATALATSTAEQAFFKAKYRQEHGEEEANRFYAPTEVKERVITQDGKESTVIEDIRKELPSVHGVWYDKSTEYARDDHAYNMQYIRSTAESLNLKLFATGWLRMNEVFDALGLERTRAGELLGWSTGESFDLHTQITHCRDEETGELLPQIYITWPEAKYIYDDVNYKWS